eukprot:s5817_g3.t1
MKAVLVLFSLSQYKKGALPWTLGPPRDAVRWNELQQQWHEPSGKPHSPSTFTTEAGADDRFVPSGKPHSPATFTTEAGADDRFVPSGKPHSPATFTSEAGGTWCYVFAISEFRADVISDSDGVGRELSKSEIREITKGIASKFNVGAVWSPSNCMKIARQGGFEPLEAIDMTVGWEFVKESHRKAVLGLLAIHRPAVVLLKLSDGAESSYAPSVTEGEDESVSFEARIAEIQMSAGRGFVLALPQPGVLDRDRHARSLSRNPQVFQVQLRPRQFGFSGTWRHVFLLTNIDEVAHRLAKTSSRASLGEVSRNSGSIETAEAYAILFVEEMVTGLRKHLQLRHFPVLSGGDHWQLTPCQLVCLHAQPRHASCVPQECDRFDVRGIRFTGKRHVVQTFVDGHVRRYTDNWMTQQPPSSQRPWTGHTIFDIEPQVMLPGSLLQAAQSLSRAAAHDFFQYQTAETQFQAEWMLVQSSWAFPSHKILEEQENAKLAENRSNHVDAEGEDVDDVDAVLREILGGPSKDQAVVGENAAGENVKAMDERLDEGKVRHELREELTNIDTKTTIEGENHVSPEVRREVYRLHRNLGHPNMKTFLRALRNAGIKTEVLRWVQREFRCPLCEARRKPDSHRPAHLSRQLEFNQVVGIDLFFIRRRPYLNVLCWGTSLQWVEVLPDKSTEVVTKAFLKSWCGHYGVPAMVVCDQGSEFTGHFFMDHVSDAGALIHLIDLKAPWQNGRTERAGAIFKQKLQMTIDEAGLVEDEHLDIAVAETLWARNQYYDRSGFSPMQRVFGKTPRIAMNLLSDDQIARELLQAPQTDHMKETLRIREAARLAWLKQQDKEAVARAVHSNTRKADAKPLKVGDLVYCWRDTSDYTGWSGPGTVIAESANGRSLWLSLRGYLIKAAREQVREATSEESLGAEIAAVVSPEMLEKIETGQVRHYQNIESEGAPPELPAPSADPGGIGEMEIESSADASRLETIAEESGIEGNNPREERTSEQMQVDSTREPSVEDHVSSAAPTPAPSTLPSRRPSIRVDEGPGGSFPFGPARGMEAATRATPYPFPAPPSWPSSARPSTFLEIDMKSDWGQDGAVTRYDRQRHRWFPREAGKRRFIAGEAGATYSMQDRCFYLTSSFIAKKKESPGQIEYSRAQPEVRKIFREARIKEIQSLLESGAVTIMSVEESRRFRREHPEHVLTSRFVDRWKPTEVFQVLPDDFDASKNDPAFAEKVKAKSRWCVVGWKDPLLHEVERAAPTPLSQSIYLFMQLCASRKWGARVKDAKTAFLQGRATTRAQKLACSQPADMAFPDCSPEQLLLLHAEVYGLVSGPSWWRRSLLEVLVKELGYRVNVYDRCVLTLDETEDDRVKTKAFKDQSRNEEKIPDQSMETFKATQGIIIIEVDDVLEAGGERHRSLMQKLEGRFKFGKVVELQKHPEGSAYAGRRVLQNQDFSFSFTMADYIQNRLKFVPMERKVAKKNLHEVPLTADEEAQLRGTIASVNWTAREGRPDASAAASIIARAFPGPTLADVVAINETVEHLKRNHVVICIHAIPEADLRHLVISDSAFDKSGQEKSQHGWILGMTTPGLSRGEEAPISLISWRSRKLRRKAGNTLLCESIALSAAMGAAEKQVAMWKSFTTAFYDPRSIAVDDEVSRGLRGPSTVIATEAQDYQDPQVIAVADAKSLYDATVTEQAQGDDDRSLALIAAHIGTAAQCVVIQPVPCIAGDVLACSDLSFRAVKGVLVTVLACAAAAVARAAIADGAMDSGWSCSRMRDQLLPGAFAGTAASMAGDTSAGRGSSTLSSGLDSVSSEQAPATGDGCATDSDSQPLSVVAQEKNPQFNVKDLPQVAGEIVGGFVRSFVAASANRVLQDLSNLGHFVTMTTSAPSQEFLKQNGLFAERRLEEDILMDTSKVIIELGVSLQKVSALGHQVSHGCLQEDGVKALEIAASHSINAIHGWFGLS